MDDPISKGLHGNTLIFKRALDRIAEKYSKLKYQDGGIEVDLSNIEWTSLDNYMDLSRKNLNSLESKSLVDLNEESLNGQDVLGTSQLDHSFIDGGANRTCVSSRELAVEDHEVMSLLDESCRTLPENEFLPEDQDEELQMSLNSNGSSLSLVELYPSMVSRIERAWHRQHVSDAASSVLKRYRRFRLQPKRSSLDSTFNNTLRRQTNRNPKTNKVLHKESFTSPVKRIRPEATPESVQQSIVTSLHDGQVQQQSPGKDRAFLRREKPHTVRVMDFSEAAKPSEISLNETFVVSEFPRRKLQLGEQVSSNTDSPSRFSYLSVMDSSFREKSSFVSSASTESVMCAKESPALKERPDIYGSPVRQSPFKTQMTNLSRSPLAFSRSPQRFSVDRCFTELKSSSLPMSLPSSPSRPVVQLRMLHPLGSHHSPRQQLHLPQSARRAGAHHSLRRHLSFDSSLPPTVSPKKVDEDFIQLYHKFVCQNKSAFFNSLPCRLCARSSEGSKGYSSSSSSLAALALSPQRAVLWKRHRELGGESYPQSKRLKDECYTYSPGSKRHRNRMLRRCLSPSELEPPRGAFSFSPSKRGMQESAARQAWMSPCRVVSADFSSLADSRERKTPNGYTPRSWQ